MSLTSYRAAPPRVGVVEGTRAFGRPGGDLLSRVLRRSTIGAEGFHGRVRDGIGCIAPRYSHQVIQRLLLVLSDCGWLCEAHGFGVFGFVAACDGFALEMIKPIERLVPVSSVHCCTSTSGLST